MRRKSLVTVSVLATAAVAAGAAFFIHRTRLEAAPGPMAAPVAVPVVAGMLTLSACGGSDSKDPLTGNKGAVPSSTPAPVVAPGDAGLFDSGKIRVQMQDGESNGFNAAPIHWDMARQLLDYVKPSTSDAFVRLWRSPSSTTCRRLPKAWASRSRP